MTSEVVPKRKYAWETATGRSERRTRGCGFPTRPARSTVTRQRFPRMAPAPELVAEEHDMRSPRRTVSPAAHRPAD